MVDNIITIPWQLATCHFFLCVLCQLSFPKTFSWVSDFYFQVPPAPGITNSIWNVSTHLGALVTWEENDVWWILGCLWSWDPITSPGFHSAAMIVAFHSEQGLARLSEESQGLLLSVKDNSELQSQWFPSAINRVTRHFCVYISLHFQPISPYSALNLSISHLELWSLDGPLRFPQNLHFFAYEPFLHLLYAQEIHLCAFHLLLNIWCDFSPSVLFL